MTQKKNGKLHAILKNNEACLYIDDTKFQGNYHVYVQVLNEDKIWEYQNNYDTHYPDKNHCIGLNNNNFADWDKLRLDTIYTISLWSHHKDFYGDHRGHFCVIQNGETAKIIEPKEVKCPTRL